MPLTAEQQQANFDWWMNMSKMTKNVIWKEKDCEFIGFGTRMNMDKVANTFIEPRTLRGYVELYENIGEENWTKWVIPPSGVNKGKVLKVLQGLSKGK